MKKPILATTISGLFLKNEAWNNAHVLWYKKAAEELGDNSIMKWVERPDYFKGVDEVMQRLRPDLSEEERTREARKTFFDSVIQYLKENPGTANIRIIAYFKSLKRKYRLALITTNTSSALEKILATTGLSGLFDIRETSDEAEKDDKILVFNRFVEKYGKPLIYIGGDRKANYDYCKSQSIPCLFANLEGDKEIAGVESAHSLKELKEKLAQSLK